MGTDVSRSIKIDEATYQVLRKLAEDSGKFISRIVADAVKEHVKKGNRK